MLTDAFCKMVFMRNGQQPSLTFDDDTTGALYELDWIQENANYMLWKCYIGGGDTAATFNDTKLESKITTLTEVSEAYTMGAQSSGSGNCITMTKVFRNDTNASIAVKEIGLFVWGKLFKVGSSSGVAKTVLFARKVLSTPVTIAAGETYSFTYQIKVQTS